MTNSTSDTDAQRLNAQFFNDNDRYLQSVSELTTYRNIRDVLSTSLRGSRRLLDIGNGGVFDYPFDVADEIVGVDLFVGSEAAARLPDHVTLVQADARDLPTSMGRFDTVAMIMLIHHLVDRDPADQTQLIREMLIGLDKVMTDDARLVIVESTVSQSFHRFESLVYPWMYRWLTRGAAGHPPVMQLSAIALAELVTERFDISAMRRIPVGGTLLQFGRRFPSALSPARPILIEARPRR